MTRKTTEFMDGPAWRTYDRMTFICTVDRPVPGWRVDRLYEDGSIGDYSSNGTRTARCLRKRFVEAIVHDPGCECGYRLLRDVYTVLQFAHIQPPKSDVALGGTWRRDLGFVLTRVVGMGTMGPPASDDPEGTIRAEKTRLEEVWLPRYVGSNVTEVQTLARKVRDRYRVTVRVMPGEDLYSFPGTPDTVPPDGWPGCALPGPWYSPETESKPARKDWTVRHGK